MQKHKSPVGFTLIELLVVIAIIGLLSTIAVVALNSARSKGRDAKRVADVRQIQTALELYLSDKGIYAASGAAPLVLGVGATSLCATSGFFAACAGTTYMGVVPRDSGMPSGTRGGCPETDSKAPCDYTYTSPAGPAPSSDKYEIKFALEAAIGGLAAGNNCATEVGLAPACRH